MLQKYNIYGKVKTDKKSKEWEIKGGKTNVRVAQATSRNKLDMSLCAHRTYILENMKLVM